MSNDLLGELIRRRAEDDAVIALPQDPARTGAAPAAVFAMRETGIIAGAGFLVFIVAATLFLYFLVP